MTKEETYEALRDQIVTITVRPGEILNEKDLMARYDIGRSPLREVLFRLLEENLLKPLPRHGYMVTTLDISEVRELVELRRELEGFAGQLAAERITEDQIQELRSIVHAAELSKSVNEKVSLIAGHRHRIRIEYINPDGRAELKLLWSSRIVDPVSLPKEALYPES